MIAMQMADQDHVDVGRLEVHALHRAQGRRSNLHQDSATGAIDDISRLKATVTGKRVAGTEHRQFEALWPQWRFTHKHC